MKNRALPIVAAVLSVMLAATLASAKASSAQELPTIEVSMTEFAFGLSAFSAPAGRVNFSTTNNGTISHNLIVIRTDLAAGALPVDGPRADTTQLGVVGVIDPVDAGAAAEATFDLSAGHYVLICNIAGHYQQGMFTTLTVVQPPTTPEPASSTPAGPTATPGAVSLPPTGSGAVAHDQTMEIEAALAAAFVATLALTALSARQLRNGRR